MRTAIFFGAIGLAIISSPASATEDDLNVWAGQFATIDAGDDVIIRLEAQERFTNDADRLGQLLLRTYAGYRLNDNVTIGGGYGYIFTDPVGPAEVNEHRIYQELTATLISTQNGVKVTSRSRLEQRFYEEDSETGHRYRNQIKLTAPISGGTNLVLYTEPFFGLNDTRFNNGGLAVWRNYAGVSVPLGNGVSVTPGYLNQHVFRDGEDRSDHIINVNLNLKF